MGKTYKQRTKACALYIQYFLRQSNIHGLIHLATTKRHLSERIVWSILIIFGFYGALTLSNKTLFRYLENPTVISMERDRFAWNTSFPSATICPSQKINQGALDEYLHKSQVNDKAKLKEFIEALAKASYSNFDEIPEYDGITSDQYMDLLLKLQFEFKPSVTSSAVNGRNLSLQQVISEMGICYSFNSQLAYYNSESYWKDNKKSLVENYHPFFVNPLDGEVFSNLVNMSTGFSIYIHGPYEVADISSKSITSDNGYFLQLYMTALTLYSSERIKMLSIAQRKCRFYDESNLKRSPVYSFVLCRMECRAALAQKLCGCTPHFYKTIAGEKVCDVAGLHCLSKHKDRLITLKRECSCHPNCEDSNYVIENYDTRPWFLGSNLQWGLKEYPKMRLKRDIIFGFSDVLVYIGGMVGLFLGCSVLSLIEVIYFFTLRLFWFTKRRYSS